MKRRTAVFIGLVFTILGVAGVAGAKEIERTVPMLDHPSIRGVPPGRVFGLNAQGTDTFYYGGTDTTGYYLSGTYKAASPGSAGWANRKMWSFGSAGFAGTPHSGFFMDGWIGVDNTAQTEDYFRVMSTGEIGDCVIDGAKSLFCGVTGEESSALCYVDQNGTGYGNNWSQTVVRDGYTYNAGDQIELDYDYTNESEPGYDFTDVILQIYDTVAEEWVDYDTLAEYTDLVSGSETIDVDSYLASLTPPVEFRIRFTFTSDGGYSDEDGYFPTTCGGFLLDNCVLDINGMADSEDFEETAIGGFHATRSLSSTVRSSGLVPEH